MKTVFYKFLYFSEDSNCTNVAKIDNFIRSWSQTWDSYASKYLMSKGKGRPLSCTDEHHQCVNRLSFFTLSIGIWFFMVNKYDLILFLDCFTNYPQLFIGKASLGVKHILYTRYFYLHANYQRLVSLIKHSLGPCEPKWETHSGDLFIHLFPQYKIKTNEHIWSKFLRDLKHNGKILLHRHW